MLGAAVFAHAALYAVGGLAFARGFHIVIINLIPVIEMLCGIHTGEYIRYRYIHGAVFGAVATGGAGYIIKVKEYIHNLVNRLFFSFIKRFEILHK